MIVNTTDNMEHQFLNILGYGQPGTGKTTFGGTAQYLGKTLFLSSERGLLSLRNLTDDDGKPLCFDYKNIDKYSDLDEVFLFLKLGKHEYKTVVMDSVTEIQKRCMEFILEEEKREKAQISDWGTLNNKMERLIRAFRDLPMNFIVTALEDSVVDKITGETKIMPELQGAFQKSISAYFDEVFYFYAKPVDVDGKEIIKHHILTRNSGKFLGKDRSGKLPQVIIDPTFSKVFNLIYKEQPKGESK